MKDSLKTIIVSFLGVIALVIGIFTIGKIGNLYEKVIGTEYQNVKTEQFNSSKAFVNDKIQSLQKFKREYDKADNLEDKIIIGQHIQDEFSNFDETKIKNNNLRDFLEDIRNGVIE